MNTNTENDTVMLKAGDVIATSTPARVGLSITRQRIQQSGDSVTVESDGVSSLPKPISAKTELA